MKILIILLMIASPILAQETTQDSKKEMSPFLKKTIGRFGYDTLEEYHQNMYVFTTLANSTVINGPDYSTGISLEMGGMFHRKNKLYSISLFNFDYLWGSQNDMFLKIGYRYGFGISFYDKRDYTGAGWLLGFNGELGLSYVAGPDYKYGYGAVAGMNFRAFYRNNYGIGMTISLLLAYNYTKLYSGHTTSSDAHGFEIRPSIGFTY